MKRKLIILPAVLLLVLLSTGLVSAQAKTIHLIRGKKLVLKGQIREGDEFSYLFRAREGQRLTVRIIGRDAVFSLYGGAVYSDSVCEEKQLWSGKLPEGDADNEYAIKMKSNYKLAGYTIEILL